MHGPFQSGAFIPIVFNMCACSDGILLSNSDLLFAKTPGWEKMDSRFRGNDNVAQELITTGMTSSKNSPHPPYNRVVQPSIPRD